MAIPPNFVAAVAQAIQVVAEADDIQVNAAAIVANLLMVALVAPAPPVVNAPISQAPANANAPVVNALVGDATPVVVEDVVGEVWNTVVALAALLKIWW